MHKVLPVLLSAACGFSSVLLTLPALAHQEQMPALGAVGATIHVDPNDTPRAGAASETWFMLVDPQGNPISLANCNCQVMVHNAQDQPIAHHIPLAEISMNGQTAIGATITFPTAGSYTVMLSGDAKDNSFQPFELMFSITAVNP